MDLRNLEEEHKRFLKEHELDERESVKDLFKLFNEFVEFDTLSEYYT